MTNQYRWVNWNRHKRVYDALIVAAILTGIAGFAAVTIALSEATPDPAVVAIRSLGATAYALLHVILVIGPLCRLNDVFLPLLYNRRHLGVATFLVALLHAVLVLGYYGGFGAVDPVTAVLFDGRSLMTLAAFPYELLGFTALVVLFALAATSHDFWLATLSPSVWKALHMSVYAAFALAVMHVALGSLQDGNTLGFGAVIAGVVVVAGLHASAGVREAARDSAGIDTTGRDPGVMGAGDHPDDDTPWVRVGTVEEIPERRAKVVCLAGQERVAVFKSEGRVSAVTNVCAHQGGPLGEGKIVDGCITCPWHGYQYDASTGRSPPPYTERIATYRVRVEGREVLLDPRPQPPGTKLDAALYNATPDDETLFEPVTPRRGRPDPDAELGLDDAILVDPNTAEDETAVDLPPPPEAFESHDKDPTTDPDAENKNESNRDTKKDRPE